jgi:cytochrome P450
MTATAPAPVYPSLEGSEDPFPFLNHLREHQPVYQIPDRPNIYLLTRYDDVKRALSEWSTFSNTEARSGLSGIWFGGGPEDATMINELDPPLHRPQRVLAQAPIAPGRLRSYVTLITELVDGLIDRFIDDGSTEFVSAFAHQLPLKLTMQLLGIPESDMDWIITWTSFESSGLSWMPDEFREGQKVHAQKMLSYLSDMLLERLENPGDDVISFVVQEQVGREGEFKMPQARAISAMLLAGGVITTAHFMASALLLLLQHRDQMAKVRADTSLIPRMLEECLRLQGPVLWQPRRMAVEIELHGITIPKGSHVLLMQAAANRDPAKFAEPDRFHVDRPDVMDHLGFGFGEHFCLGAPLARLESRIAFERLFARLADIRLIEPQRIEHIRSPQFRGVRSLNIEFDAAAQD